MRDLAEKGYDFIMYGVTSAYLMLDFDSVHSAILFTASFIMIILRIVLYIKQIKKVDERSSPKTERS